MGPVIQLAIDRYIGANLIATALKTCFRLFCVQLHALAQPADGRLAVVAARRSKAQILLFGAARTTAPWLAVPLPPPPVAAVPLPPRRTHVAGPSWLNHVSESGP